MTKKDVLEYINYLNDEYYFHCGIQDWDTANELSREIDELLDIYLAITGDVRPNENETKSGVNATN